MPSLDWIGKKAVVNHHKQVPFHLLRCNEELSVGDAGSGNLLVQGDNLVALKALLPYYAGQVKCIYIDPPYNTGNESWVYNDNVNSPEMREWLGNVVGKESDDLSRHDKWLCMMYPRLMLAKEFLSDDGIIFVSIDDNELPLLRLLMDEIFHRKNLLSCFIWQTEGNFDNQAKVKICHEYILAYQKDASLFPAPPIVDPNTAENSKLFRSEIRNTIVKNGPKNPVSGVHLPVGFPADFAEGVIQKRSSAWPHYTEDLIIKDFKLQNTVIASSGWSSKKILLSFIKSGYEVVKDSKGQETSFVISRTGAIETVKKRSDKQSHVISVLREVGTTQQMSAILATHGIKFDYPKPTGLIEYLISMVTGNDFIVLDFFAGSGTTANAVINVNFKDEGIRKYILAELDEKIIREICSKRISLALSEKKTSAIQQHGFRFCELGEQLFDAEGSINKAVTFKELAHHIFFIATGEPLPPETDFSTPFLGTSNNIAVYLLYNGILGDHDEEGGNVLTRPVLSRLPKHDGTKIVYGNGCLLGSSLLNRENIIFRQIPYEVRCS
jgi:adenine-specific DNA-methyltransferase